MGAIGICAWIAVARSEPLGLLTKIIAIATSVFAVVFCVMGESIIEDGVKTVMIGLMGLMSLAVIPTSVPLSLAMTPGVACIVASSLNWWLKEFSQSRRESSARSTEDGG